ncbi:histone 2A-domain-containing protein [Golden Marseillevirus]|uniref:histone 2A-domain-containing protein n=1 Tax=Golden Marseillevirus TaxID=1720526 RepID=UPI000877A9B4|nr:histone 2A-domain-containing protein [Golden Marseillevirus]ALX27444.1 histone 2A-domain-containing protein [Golden Marseillevirus]
MERVGKYSLFIKRKVPSDFDITAEALEQVNNMLLFLANRALRVALIVLDEKKRLCHKLIIFLLGDVAGGFASECKKYCLDVLQDKQVLVFPTKRTENLMRQKTSKRIGKPAVKTMTAVLEFFLRQNFAFFFSPNSEREKKKDKSPRPSRRRKGGTKISTKFLGKEFLWANKNITKYFSTLFFREHLLVFL